MFARCGLTALALAATALASPVANAAGPSVDPTRSGAHTVTRIDYDAGPTVLSVQPTNGAPVLAELHGEVFVPSGRGPFAVLLFQHGRHASCSYAGYQTFGQPCITTPITEPVDSYRGYDYLARSLASNGYLVVSVDTNGVNSYDVANLDGGALARAELISRNLDLLKTWSVASGPGDVGDRLRGRVDLSRMGLMGHSRGGEGVTYWLGYNSRRTDGPRYRVSAVFALAPIDFTSQVVSDVPWATMLPRCDGDVYDMEGAWAFERAKYAQAHRRSPLFQFVVEGANHNWFNTTWTSDDAASKDAVCNAKSQTTDRLSPAEQRRVGQTYIAAFLRRYVGGERAFESLLTGSTQRRIACSRTLVIPCASLVRTSYLPGSARRITLLRPRVDDSGQFAAEAGTRVRLTGHVRVEGCDSSRKTLSCPLQNDGSAGTPGWSLGPQLTVTWSGRSEIEFLPRDPLHAQRSDDLVLRLAADSGSNPEGDPQRPGANAVVVQLALVDGRGRRSVVDVTRDEGAPEPPPGTITRNLLLSDVRVPLRAFHGVDLGDVRAVGLVLGARSPEGRLQLADVSLQRR